MPKRWFWRRANLPLPADRRRIQPCGIEGMSPSVLLQERSRASVSRRVAQLPEGPIVDNFTASSEAPCLFRG